MRPFEIRPGIRRLFRLAVRADAPARRAEADEEIRLHLQLRAEQLAREGLSPEAARAEAERRFGPVDEARLALDATDARRDGRRRLVEALGGARQGLRATLRGMWRTPGFLATAVTCIALGVGANAAAFSLVDELLLRPLPVRDPARLVNLGAPGPKPGGDQCNDAGSCEEVFSLPMYRDLERTMAGTAQLAAHRLFIAGFAYDGHASDGEGTFVSGSYFPVLGLKPALGRLLRPEDDVTPGGHPVVVVSHAYWMTQLGGDPAVIGRTLLVNGRSLTIVGVAPRGFEGTTLGRRPRVYVPIVMAATVDPFFGPVKDLANRRRYWVYAFARLRPTVSLEGARAAINVRYHGILADVEASLQKELSVQTLARFKAKPVTVEDGRYGQSMLRGTTRTPLMLLLGITGLVVLIACANIANLLLVRGAGRATEIAVRISLGAGRRQLVAQLLTEACVLAALGGAASLLVARVLLSLIGSFIPASSFGMGVTLVLALRPSVLVFAAVMSLGTGLLFGLFPALHATRPDLIAAIRAGAGQIAGGHRAAARFRASLVTAQIALSMALLGTAGLFIKSLRNIGHVELGMNVDQAVTFALLPELAGYDLPHARALIQRAEREVATLPGVTAVGASSVPLFTTSSNGGNVRVEGFTRGPDTDANTRMNQVGPGFFRALRVPILAGREFTDADRLGAPKVAIVNEAFAKKFGLGRNPLGKRLSVDGDSRDGALDTEIVGLVRDAGYSGVKDDAPAMLIRPYRQDSTIGATAFYVGTTGAPDAVVRAIPSAIARIDRNLPVPLLKPLSQQVRENVYLDRMVGTLSAGFAALATLLAAVGLYGVLAYTVAQRAREIGVRMALGADAGRVRGLVLRQVARMALVGGALGIAAALLLGHAAQSLLFGLRGFDPPVVLAAAAVLTVVTLGAGYLPAWRASRVDPVRVLRGE